MDKPDFRRSVDYLSNQCVEGEEGVGDGGVLQLCCIGST